MAALSLVCQTWENAELSNPGFFFLITILIFFPPMVLLSSKALQVSDRKSAGLCKRHTPLYAAETLCHWPPTSPGGFKGTVITNTLLTLTGCELGPPVPLARGAGDLVPRQTPCPSLQQRWALRAPIQAFLCPSDRSPVKKS